MTLGAPRASYGGPVTRCQEPAIDRILVIEVPASLVK